MRPGAIVEDGGTAFERPLVNSRAADAVEDGAAGAGVVSLLTELPW